MNLTATAQEISVNELVRYFPNPTTKSLSLEFNETKQNISVRISTIEGFLVNEMSFGKVRFIRFDLPEPEGIYLVDLIDEAGSVKTLRVQKQ